MDDLLICDDFSCVINSSIIIYGTGYWGKTIFRTLKELKANIVGVCNTDRRKDLFYDYSVLSVCDIKNLYDDSGYLLIIASMDYYEEMIHNCEKLFFDNIKICSIYAFYISLYMHYCEKKIPRQMKVDIEHNLMASEKRLEYANKLYAYNMMVHAVEEDKVLIYQPGKVGSQSVWNSIRNDSVQFHSLVIPFGCGEFSKGQLEHYLSKIRNKQVKIITGVREPIARDLAAMFQNSDLELWPLSDMNSNIFWSYGDFLYDASQELTFSELMKRAPRWRKSLSESFRQLSMSIVEYELDEFSWFNYEIKSVFGIDLFLEPFDREKGYEVIRKKNVEIFVYKMEKLGELQRAIGDFLGRKDYQLKNTNLSNNKIYYYAYEQLKEKIKLSKKYFDYYYNNNLLYQHFYTDKEIDKYKKIWEMHVDDSI